MHHRFPGVGAVIHYFCELHERRWKLQRQFRDNPPDRAGFFSITASPTAAVTVAQGYSNSTNPFTVQNQMIVLTATPLHTYGGTVLLNTPMCSV